MIFPLLLLLLIVPAPSRAATVIGSFSGLSESQYDDIWKVANASPQPLIMADQSGDSELRGLYTGNVQSNGCQLYVTSQWVGNAAIALDFVEVGTIATINGIPIGVVEVDLSPLRCLVAYNFDAMGPISETPSPPEETPSEPSCEETDGGFDVYVRGVMTHSFDGPPNPATDTCISSTNIIEYYCDTSLYDGSHATQTSCPYGCQEGRCLTAAESGVDEPEPSSAQCQDTDGGFDPFTQGSLIQAEATSDEECVDAETLREFSCGGSTWTTDQEILWTCQNGCVDGRCLTDEEAAVGPGATEETEPNVVFTSCQDSDYGLAPHTAGTITLGGPDIATSTVDDTCVSDTQLIELYCDAHAANQSGSQSVSCPGGCVDGACVTSLCEETDDGFDKYVGGTMTHDRALLPNPAVDVCTAPTKLREYACGYGLDDQNPTNDTVASVSCSYGCVTDDDGQGRCRGLVETLNPLNLVQTLSIWLSWLLSLFGG